MATMNPHITERRRNPERRSGTDHSMARRLGACDWLAMVLMIGDGTTAARVVYALVGLAALYSIYTLSRLASDNQH